MQNGNGNSNGVHRGTYLFSIEIRTEPDGELFTVYADQLGLVATGETVEEARENMRDTVLAYCRMRDKRGVLDEALAEAGVQWRFCVG